MNIPDKAVEAAAKAEYELTDETWSDLYESDQDNWKRYARAALEAAAPIIAAQALRDEADRRWPIDLEDPQVYHERDRRVLHDRADELDPHE